jgi:hypothetical protein
LPFLEILLETTTFKMLTFHPLRKQASVMNFPTPLLFYGGGRGQKLPFIQVLGGKTKPISSAKDLIVLS